MSMATAQAAAPAEPGSGDGRRALGAVLCAVLGIGCLGGAALGGWAEHHAAHRPPTAEAAYRRAGSLWHTAPVDSLFPPVLATPDTGPGGADRTWTRVALAPDSECGPALTPDWQAALAPTGCTRVLRATYTDATRSSLVAVGLVFTPADAPAAMAALDGRLTAPPAYGFGDGRRAAWTAAVLPDAPVVVYTVSAFADGRTLPAPVPAADAVRKDAAGAVAQAGLGHGAKAVGEGLERTVRELVAAPSGEAAGGDR
ncbi:hypothetical protein AB0953_18685 [Streptomyces sp. NPDC046866]|uniref:hypothetical protein n=1 Tax=Streptomyces sp. NPDC046866 TaxID=3154921 RepID=UPI00345441B5